MYQEERVQAIVEHLKNNQTMTTREIAERFEISKDTARRDIIAALKTGKVIRTHGGVMLADDSTQILNYWERSRELQPAKQRMAECASELLVGNQVVFLDVSTTLFLLAQSMDVSCSVYTHSLDSAFSLAQNNKIDLHLLGGSLDYDNRFFYAEDSLAKLRNITFDVALIGAASLESDGVYFKEEKNALIKRLVVKRARKVILVAETQKFTKQSNYKACDYKDVDVFVTDQEIPCEMRQYFNDEMQIIY